MAHHFCGGLAQLVERLLCKQDVSGSSPLTSTNDQLGVGLGEFSTCLGLGLNWLLGENSVRTLKTA